MPQTDLSAKRQELARIDEELVRLVGERQRVAKEIGAIKRASGIGTRDFGQERDVIERARGRADELGVSPDVAEELMLLLIRSSLTAQEQDAVSSAGSGEGKPALVIGGAGRMGQWVARFLTSQGYSVEIADPSGPVAGFAQLEDWQSADLQHELIVVAAPLRASANILRKLGEKNPPGIIFDVASLKSPIREPLAELARMGCRVTSIHPMFGPDTELLSGRHVIFVDVGCSEATEKAKALFTSTMARQVDMDLDSHDRMIAYVLGLSHALNIAFFTALAESGEAAPILAELSSSTFDAQLDVAARVAGDNPYLYFEIQNLNDYGTESLSALLYATERIRSVVRAGDESGFVALMERGRDYLKPRNR